MIKSIEKALAKLPVFKRVVVGISGGADSVALAHFLHSVGYEVILAHLNHGLRAEESDGEAEFVDSLSKEWGVECEIERAEIADDGNLENNCRIARYDFLERVRQKHFCDFVAVAHHKNDQVETILMHMLRGSGIKGMRGMSVRNGHLIRPFLHVSKGEVLSYMDENNLDYCIDSSNMEMRFFRNHLRHEVIPELKKERPSLEDDLILMGEQAQKEWAIIDEQATDWMEKNYRDQQFKRGAFLQLNDVLQGEVLFRMAGHQDLYRVQIKEVQALIRKGETNKRKKLGGLTFELEYDTVKVHNTAFKVRGVEVKRKKLGKVGVRWGNWQLKNESGKTLYVRNWKPGDRFVPNGMKGSKKLQDFFVDQKVPKTERHEIPVIVNEDDEILAVGNLRLARKGAGLKSQLLVTKAASGEQLKIDTMFKKAFIMGIALAALSQHAIADTSYRITVDRAINRRNIVVTHPETNQRYLLYLAGGCGSIRDGQSINLSIRGNLNSNHDRVAVDSLHSCRVADARPFDEEVQVSFVYDGNTEAHVFDEAGTKYAITYPLNCRLVSRYINDYVYIEKAGRTIDKGAIMHLPNRDGNCTIEAARIIQQRETIRPRSDKSSDRRRPTTPFNVKAIPGNKEITLTWRKATDNVGIDKYVVSYSKSRITTRTVPFISMPNRTETKDNFITIKGLENNRTYFFYVIAVDESGNRSSRWSRVASTRPRATALSSERKPSGGLFLNLELLRETDRTLLFQWSPPSDTQRQTIILEADGRRIFTSTHPLQRRLRILKRSIHKGKELKLTVRAYDIASLLIEESTTFSY